MQVLKLTVGRNFTADYMIAFAKDEIAYMSPILDEASKNKTYIHLKFGKSIEVIETIDEIIEQITTGCAVK